MQNMGNIYVKHPTLSTMSFGHKGFISFHQGERPLAGLNSIQKIMVDNESKSRQKLIETGPAPALNKSFYKTEERFL